MLWPVMCVVMAALSNLSCGLSRARYRGPPAGCRMPTCQLPSPRFPVPHFLAKIVPVGSQFWWNQRTVRHCPKGFPVETKGAYSHGARATSQRASKSSGPLRVKISVFILTRMCFRACTSTRRPCYVFSLILWSPYWHVWGLVLLRTHVQIYRQGSGSDFRSPMLPEAMAFYTCWRLGLMVSGSSYDTWSSALHSSPGSPTSLWKLYRSFRHASKPMAVYCA